jgi:transcriptional regulator GlxA family with amidase domain
VVVFNKKGSRCEPFLWNFWQVATMRSVCSGVLLLAETGLLDGNDATMQWVYASTFKQNFPQVHSEV